MTCEGVVVLFYNYAHSIIRTYKVWKKHCTIVQGFYSDYIIKHLQCAAITTVNHAIELSENTKLELEVCLQRYVYTCMPNVL